jgi:hypothetical protein
MTLIQNTAIKAFDKAQYIYKIDEDIFVTKHFFSKLYECYEHCEKYGKYRPSFIGPLIPLNSYGYVRIIEKLSLQEEYEKRFNRLIYGRDVIHENQEVAKYFWGEDFPKIDELDELFGKDDITYTICPIRYSIGAILFKRETWENMNYFTVNPRGYGAGEDEFQLCGLAMQAERLAIVVSENTVVGHFSYAAQNEVMKEYFLNNPSRFDLVKLGSY